MAKPLYNINFEEIAYHRCFAPYIIKPQESMLTQDEIQTGRPKSACLMIYTLVRDEIPNLRFG
jgi:hypothetical protein